jgi:hypothetical protein
VNRISRCGNPAARQVKFCDRVLYRGESGRPCGPPLIEQDTSFSVPAGFSFFSCTVVSPAASAFFPDREEGDRPPPIRLPFLIRIKKFCRRLREPSPRLSSMFFDLPAAVCRFFSPITRLCVYFGALRFFAMFSAHFTFSFLY